MFKRSVMTFIVGLLLALMAGAVGYSRVRSAETGWPLQGASKQEAQIREISGYRQWARVTPEPQLVISPSGLD
jgi:hypothetical protein